ncbi:glutamate--tRNA ligase [Candidatus Nomurabacteria bacterium]|nr:glutamate--tRNA ligase [Candidatus Nomurabacteria bacterium]MCB9818228.1 glutamate--tRNA ligase [Candidatus Nomurabacteria bacterium]
MDHKNTTNKVVTRFAPSPTGFLHTGSVRTALYAYLFACKNNGTFILRIEDTDKAREVDGAVQHIQDSMRWLGIEWNYGPDKPGPFGSCIQSERLGSYKKYAQQLIDKGLAYPDPYTQEEIESFRELAKNEERPFLYRHHRPEKFDEWDGTKPLRLKTPEIKRYEWNDVVRGKLSAGEEMLDDFIIIKADGYPTYNFAHIIDDLEMGVTHVMRGEEFISSTPKYLSLYDALEIPYPTFVTLPPIMGPDGKKKLSKRDGAKDLLDFKKEGYLPEAMRNFLALIGWNPGGNDEIFPSSESENTLVEKFSLEKIQRSGGAFNEEKLKWMNKEYLLRQNQDFLLTYLKEAIPDTITSLPQFSDERLKKLSPVVFERIHNKAEIVEASEAGEYDFAFSAPEYEKELLLWKNDSSVEESLPRLKKTAELLNDADFRNTETIKQSIWQYAEEVGRGEVLWPLRTSLSGRKQSPDPFTLAYILGKEETISRIQTACDKISG